MNDYLFIGLGNPGQQYDKTRHNLGLAALHAWVDQQQARGYAVTDWRDDSKISAQLAQVNFTDKATVTCLWPAAGMNNSGQAVAEYLKYHPFETPQILIIHDDMEISLGEVKIKSGGSAAGHNGVRSIQTALSTQDIARLRLGIGRPVAGAAEDYVLQKFTASEESAVKKMLAEACELLSERLSVV